MPIKSRIRIHMYTSIWVTAVNWIRLGFFIIFKPVATPISSSLSIVKLSSKPGPPGRSDQNYTLNTIQYLVNMGISLWQAMAYIRLDCLRFWNRLNHFTATWCFLFYVYIFDRDRQGMSSAKTKTKTMTISNDKIK